MNAVAPTTTAPTVTERRISKRVRHACDLLLSGEVKTIKAAADRANLTREHLSRSLQEPHVRTFIAREIAKNIGTAQMRATGVLEKLMDEGKSEHVRRDVSRYFLELAGHTVAHNAQSLNINVDVKAGYVIDLAEPSREPVTIDAKPVEQVQPGRALQVENTTPHRTKNAPQQIRTFESANELLAAEAAERGWRR